MVIDNRNEYRLSPLMPSFGPFMTRDTLSSGQQPLMEILLDDKAEISTDGYRDLGHYDSVDIVHGVYLNDDGRYIFSLNEVQGVPGAYLTADRSFAHCIISLKRQSSRAFDLRIAIMLAYAMATADKDTFLIHSSVVLNRGRAYMFLGKSGTGKSTHTRLWRESVPCSSLLNDDNPVVRIEHGRPVVYGTPWSGKTPCYRQHSAPVAAIVLLRQAPYNQMRMPQSVAERMSIVYPSVTNMRWDKRVNNGVISAIGKLMTTTNIGLMDCLPDSDAARISYETLSRL